MKLYLFSILTCFFIVSLPCQAQNEQAKDSLWNIWKNQKQADTLRLDALESYLYEVVYYEPNRAIELGRQHLELSKKLNDSKREANAHYAIAYTFYDIGTFDKALVHYEISSTLYASLNDVSSVSQIKLAQGHIYRIKKRINKALQLYLEADSLATQQNDLERMIPAKLYSLNINYEQGNYKKCLELSAELDPLFTHPDLKNNKIAEANLFLAKSLVYSIVGKKKDEIAATLKAATLNEERHYINFAASLYSRTGELQLAEGDTLGGLATLKRAYRLLNKLEDRYGSDAAMYAMSMYRYVNKEYALAIQYIDSSLMSIKKRRRDNNYSELYYHKGLIKLRTQRYNEALVNCTKALEETKENGKIEIKEKCFRCLYEVHFKLKNYKKALSYFKKAESIEDSIFSKDQVRELAVQEVSNEFDLERQKITLLHDAEIEKEHQSRKILLGVSLTSGCILVLGFLTYSNRRKRIVAQHEQQLQENFTQQLLQTTEDERSRIAGDLHDSVNHQLLHLKQKAQMGKSIKDEELAKVIEQVRNISHNLSPAMFEQVGLEKSIEELCSKIMEISDLRISTLMTYNKQLTTKQELQIYRVIEEALNNILKHSEASHALIKIVNDASQLQINIKDNGKGFDVGIIDRNKLSFGMANIKQRAKTLKGKLHFKSNNSGTEINLSINS